MSELKIPETAYTAGANAYDDADPDSRWSEAINAAAPLIVAAELRRLITELSDYRFNHVDTILEYCRDRADDLDPQGVTK